MHDVIVLLPLGSTTEDSVNRDPITSSRHRVEDYWEDFAITEQVEI